jgi:cyclohexadieny/prephenate dehydrogenase
VNKLKFESVLIIGVGLIGSSLARAIREHGLAGKIYGLDTSSTNLEKCNELAILSEGADLIDCFSEQFDLILICSPLSTYKSIFASLNSYITQDTLVTDVGSTKMSVIRDFKETVTNNYIQFLPSHPIAGLEKSGAEFGFSQLFVNRFCIITPINNTNNAINVIKQFWTAIGMKIEIMDAEHHDKVLAMTSHIPQLIAYSIVSTATELEKALKDEVIKYSAAGFRDFTRLAGSDPIMWRDVYSLNKNAVLEMLSKFTKDLSTLQKAIQDDDLSFLEETFRNTRKVRKIIEELGQAGSFDPREHKEK